MFMKNALHFVGFKDDRFRTACKVFGKPDFIHRFHDNRFLQEFMEGDVAVFATGDEHQKVWEFAYDDSAHF
jgi:hypothetical protein